MPRLRAQPDNFEEKRGKKGSWGERGIDFLNQFLTFAAAEEDCKKKEKTPTPKPTCGLSLPKREKLRKRGGMEESRARIDPAS